MKSGELDGEWRVKSGEWREVWGNVCGHRGTERTGNVLRAGWPARVPCNPAPTDGGTFAAVAEQSGQATCRGPDSPQGCPAIRPLRIGFLSIAIRKVSGGNDVPAGGACPAPTSKEPFAAIAEQRRPGDVGGDYRGSASGVHIIR